MSKFEALKSIFEPTVQGELKTTDDLTKKPQNDVSISMISTDLMSADTSKKNSSRNTGDFKAENGIKCTTKSTQSASKLDHLSRHNAVNVASSSRVVRLPNPRKSCPQSDIEVSSRSKKEGNAGRKRRKDEPVLKNTIEKFLLKKEALPENAKIDGESNATVAKKENS